MKFYFTIIYCWLYGCCEAQEFPNLNFSRINEFGIMCRSGFGPLRILNHGSILSWAGFKSDTLFSSSSKKEIGWAGVEKIIEQDSIIWIKYFNGISAFNKNTKKIIHYSQNNTNKNFQIKNEREANIFIDNKGKVFILAGYLYWVDKNLCLHEITALTPQLIKLNQNVVHKGLYEDKAGQVWGIFDYKTIVLFNSDKTIRKIWQPENLKKGRALKIYHDSFGRYLLGTWWGLQVFDTLTGQTKLINGNFKTPYLISDINEWQDNLGNRWIVLGCAAGLTLVNPFNLQQKTFSNSFGKDYSHTLPPAAVDNIFIDAENIMWLNTAAGIAYVAPQQQYISHYLMNNTYQYKVAPLKFAGEFLSVNLIDSLYWVGGWWGAGTGMFKKNMQLVNSKPINPMSLNNNATDSAWKFFRSAVKLPDGNLLFTSEPYVGIYYKNGKIDLFNDKEYAKQFPIPPDVIFNKIIAINDTQYLISSVGIVFLFDYRTKKLSRLFDIRNEKEITQRPGYLQNIIKQQNSFWFLYEAALVKYDWGLKNTVKIFAKEINGKNNFPTSSAHNFIEDKKGNLLIACDEGILKYSDVDDHFIILSTENNIPKNIRNICKDNTGRLWFLHNDIVAYYNEKEKTTHSFYVNVQLPENEIAPFLQYDSTTDRIFFQGAAGCFSFFNPSALLNQTSNQKLFIQNINYNGEVLFKDSIPKSIRLPYYKNYLSIQAEFIFLNVLQKQLLAWRLNKNEPWKYSKTGEIVLNALADGSYNLELTTADNIGEINSNNIVSYVINIAPPFYKTWWFAFLLLAFVGGTAFTWRSSIEKRKLKEKTLQAKMNELSLVMLRSQMNPHFLFNCLNSIKLYTMQNNNVAATEYLGKFSKLIRSMLDASRNDTITLADELNALQLFIDLEVMRFKHKLQYKIIVDENIDTEFIEVPPLIIQPYIENAIWHGLMHKEEGGLVNLHIERPKENLLLITITDNGIGRAKAAELKSKVALLHKSHGTKVTAERIALLKEKYGVEADVSIIDLYDDAKQPMGTKVIITLPLV